VLVLQGPRTPTVAAVEPPAAVQEYDFGGPGPAGDLKWGGRAVAIDISPANKDVALVASSTGGMWRTGDGGLTWTLVTGFPMFFPHDVKFDPNDQTIVYATTDGDGRTTTQAGVWRSTDGGVTWSRASTPFPCSSSIAWGLAIVAGADTHNKVFVANDCGVAYSNDRGVTWTNVDPSGGTPTKFTGVAAVRTGSGSAVAYACSTLGVYRATVSGSAAPSWSLLTNAAGTTGSNWCQVAISPLDPNTTFVTTEVFGGADPYEIDVNTSATPVTATVTKLDGPGAGDGARPPTVLTHRAVDGDPTHFDLYFSTGQRFFRQHCISDGSPATVDCGAGAETGSQCTNAVDDDGDQMINEGCPKVGSAAENEDLVPSQCKNAVDDDGDGVVNDGCSTMEHFDNGTHVDPNDIAFDPSVADGTGCALLTTNDGGVGRSTDCGVSWADSNAGFHALQVYNVWGTLRGSGPTDTDLYFGTHDNEWWFSLDNGGTWTKAFCCEGFLGQTDYRVPPGGLSDIRIVFVNCGPCGNGTSDRGLVNPVGWPNPLGGAWGTDRLAAAAIMFGHDQYVQVASGGTSPPTYGLYVMRPETGAQCANALDDDDDGLVNDGCPTVGSGETGTACHNAVDDDGDGAVNDGCSGIFSPEAGSECTNSTDDDGDGAVNDGCPRTGTLAETGAACRDAVDANEDGAPDGVNDGCPEVGAWAQMGSSFSEPPNRAPVVASGPSTGPVFYFGVEATSGTWKLRKMTGALNTTATYGDASGTGANTLASIQQAGNQFYYPLVFAAAPDNPAHLYAADGGTSQMKYSLDGGLNWYVDAALTSLVTNNGEYEFLPWRIVYDPEDSDRILVSTRTAGIVATTDGGGHWFHLPGSSQIPMATGFFFDRDHDVIYASSFGRGLWTVSLPEADLRVTKTSSPDPATAGTELYYTVTVTNDGPQAATVEAVDTLPSEVTFVDDTLPSPLGCTEAPAGTVTCRLGVLGAGSGKSFRLKVAVSPDAVVAVGPKSIFNSVTVRSTDSGDPDPADNTAVEATLVEDSADLAVSKLCKPDTTVLAGTAIDCTVFVDNHGPSSARGVVVDDTMLASGSFVVSNVSPALGTGIPGCTLATVTGGQSLTCRLADLDPASATATGRAVMSYRLTATEGMDIDNVAVVRSDTPDPNVANDAAVVPLTVTAVADLSIAKSAPASADAGTDVTWTITVANAGPSTATNVIVTDILPPGVEYRSATVSTGSGSCTAGVPGDADQPITCGLGTMGPSGPSASRTIEIVARIDPDTTGILGNDTRITSSTLDPNSANNFSHSDTMVDVNVGLELTMVGSPDPVASGTVLTYRSTARNNGPSTAKPAWLEIELPDGTTYLGATAPAGVTCGLLTPSQLRCIIPRIAPLSAVDVFVDVRVASSVQSNVTLIAEGDLSAPGATTVTTSAFVLTTRVSDLGVILTSDANVYKPSKVIHYSIVMTNAGPSDASGVTFTLNLPPTKWAIYDSNDGGCAAPLGTAMTCDIGVLRAGETKVVVVNILIRGNKGTVTATVDLASNGAPGSPASADPFLANNTSIRVVTVK
jgi:uncharacterized repeat protein (TIGR01451 family)